MHVSSAAQFSGGEQRACVLHAYNRPAHHTTASVPPHRTRHATNTRPRQTQLHKRTVLHRLRTLPASPAAAQVQVVPCVHTGARSAALGTRVPDEIFNVGAASDLAGGDATATPGYEPAQMIALAIWSLPLATGPAAAACLKNKQTQVGVGHQTHTPHKAAHHERKGKRHQWLAWQACFYGTPDRATMA